MKNITISLTSDLLKQLKKIQKENKKTISELIRLSLNNYFGNNLVEKKHLKKYGKIYSELNKQKDLK